MSPPRCLILIGTHKYAYNPYNLRAGSADECTRLVTPLHPNMFLIPCVLVLVPFFGNQECLYATSHLSGDNPDHQWTPQGLCIIPFWELEVVNATSHPSGAIKAISGPHKKLALGQGCAGGRDI